MTRLALVLAGGAAHGAYEVGVIRYLATEVARDVGVPPRFDLLCGTSVGALNAAVLAAHADDPAQGAGRLAETWRTLRLPELLRVSPRGVLAMARSLLGSPRARVASLFANAPLARLLRDTIAFDRIAEHLAAGRLAALTVSTTHVASGQTTVFVDQAAPLLPQDVSATSVLRPARLGIEHVLASAAVPLLFPPVELEGELHCDGGLRQMVPLAPALRLGATAMVVPNPRHPPEDEPEAVRRSRERAYGSPVFLLGRTLDVLLVDRVREDLDRTRHVNAILDAGTRRYGRGFAAGLSRELATAGHRPLRRVATVEVRSSEDVARLAADFVRSPRFPARAGAFHARLFRYLADAEGSRETTFLSYLMLDGDFASQLMELGRAHARRQPEELCGVMAAARGWPRRRRERGAARLGQAVAARRPWSQAPRRMPANVRRPATLPSPIWARAVPGHVPESAQPTPKRTAPSARPRTIGLVAMARGAPPRAWAARRRRIRKPAAFSATATPMTPMRCRSVSSNIPAIAAGSVAPTRLRMNPNTRPKATRRALMRHLPVR
jgi:NTE family protein